MDAWLERLGIAHLRSRSARRLSGGEAQRVSLARAFAIQPDLLMLDEPFSALDAPTRMRLMEDFQSLLAETGLTTVFITHDRDEAIFLGDRVAVLLEGGLRQVGTPQEVFTAPLDPQVAAFVGVETILPGEVIASQDGHLVVDAGWRASGSGWPAAGWAQSVPVPAPGGRDFVEQSRPGILRAVQRPQPPDMGPSSA